MNCTPPSKKRIGIFNFWWTPNYGALLTALALQRYTQHLGYDSTLVNYAFASYEVKKCAGSIFEDFAKNELQFTQMMREEYELSRLNQEFDCFIAGSDQVWRYEYTRGTDLALFFRFAAPEKKLISYAASFGVSEWKWTEGESAAIRSLISRFDAVSVRESSGIELCRSHMDCEAEWVVDPVFFYDKQWWSELAHKAVEALPPEYIATYILDASPKIEAMLKELHLPIVNASDIEGKKASVYYWLKAIRDSSCLITDSYHGMCFAIIFRKRFAVIANKERGYSRFESLLTFDQMMGHIVDCDQPDDLKEKINIPVDEIALEERMATFIVQSKLFLQESLKGRSKNNKLTYTLYVHQQMLEEVRVLSRCFFKYNLLKLKLLRLFSWGKRRVRYQQMLKNVAKILKKIS